MVAPDALRVTELFGGHMTAATWRARAIAAAGRCSEDFDLGRLARWPVAALAIDRPRDLLAAAASRVTRP